MYSGREPTLQNCTFVLVSTVLWFAGCDISIPIIDSNMDELSPWANVQATDSLSYVEKFSKPGMEPRFLAEATFQSQHDIERLISAFDLKEVHTIKSTWPISFFQAVRFKRNEATKMYSATHPMPGGENYTVIVINLWVDYQSKVLVIEKDWQPRLEAADAR